MRIKEHLLTWLESFGRLGRRPEGWCNKLNSVGHSYAACRSKILRMSFSLDIQPVVYGVCQASPWILFSGMVTLSAKDAKKLEGVQRIAAWVVTGFSNVPHEDSVARLKLISSERRRQRDNISATFHIISGACIIDPELFFEPRPRHNRWGHDLNIARKRPWLVPQAYFFSQRMENAWNSPPARFLVGGLQEVRW